MRYKARRRENEENLQGACPCAGYFFFFSRASLNWSLHEKGSMRFHSVKSEKDGLGRFVKKKSFFGACAAGENTGREDCLPAKCRGHPADGF